MDYMANILNNAGILPAQVTLRWLKELTLPTYDTQGTMVDAVSAFATDDKLDAVMAISPDALKLTSNGTVGTGSEGSVKGARVLLSTKTASRIIADVYAVRKDYFDTHRAEVQKFVHAVLRSQEALTELLANKPSQQAKYRQLLAASTPAGPEKATSTVWPESSNRSRSVSAAARLSSTTRIVGFINRGISLIWLAVHNDTGSRQ